MDTRMIGFHSLILMVVAVQYRVQWLDSVNLAMNFPVPYKLGHQLNMNRVLKKNLQGLGVVNMSIYAQYVCGTQIKTFLPPFSTATQFTTVSLGVRIRLTGLINNISTMRMDNVETSIQEI